MEGKVKDIPAHYLRVQYNWLGNHHKLTYYKDFITPQMISQYAITCTQLTMDKPVFRR